MKSSHVAGKPAKKPHAPKSSTTTNTAPPARFSDPLFVALRALLKRWDRNEVTPDAEGSAGYTVYRVLGLLVLALDAWGSPLSGRILFLAKALTRDPLVLAYEQGPSPPVAPSSTVKEPVAAPPLSTSPGIVSPIPELQDHDSVGGRDLHASKATLPQLLMYGLCCREGDPALGLIEELRDDAELMTGLCRAMSDGTEAELFNPPLIAHAFDRFRRQLDVLEELYLRAQRAPAPAGGAS